MIEEFQESKQAVPPGTITILDISATEIPPGWVLCDGSNGSPDLYGKFAKGASGTGELKENIGANTFEMTSEQLPPHSHTGTSTVDGEHTHSYGVRGVYNSLNEATTHNSDDVVDGTSSSHDGEHVHDIDLNGVGFGSPIWNHPPYTDVLFIMRL